MILPLWPLSRDPALALYRVSLALGPGLDRALLCAPLVSRRVLYVHMLLLAQNIGIALDVHELRRVPRKESPLMRIESSRDPLHHCGFLACGRRVHQGVDAPSRRRALCRVAGRIG